MRLTGRIIRTLFLGWLVSRSVSAAPDAGTIALLRQQLDAQTVQMQQMNARIAALEKFVARLAGFAGSPAVSPASNASAQAASSPAAEPPPESTPSPSAQTALSSTRLHISGYADVTSVYRSSFTGTGIATSFGSIPLQQAPEARLAEFRGAANHSRLSVQLDTRLAGRDVTSYAEMDFLGNAQPNVFAGSNSHTLRLRLYWAQFRGEHWELLGGQSWTLLAPNRVGISPRPYEIMHTMLPDPNYSVGLAWTRQATIRATRHWKRLHLAAALENPEQNVLDSLEVPQDVVGLDRRTNPGSNIRPDFLIKAAYDTSIAHLEAVAIGRSFQVYSISRGRDDRALGGGFSVAGVIHAGSRIDLVTQNLASAGGGRYAQALVPDVVVRPDGRLVRITTYSTLQGVEAKATPNLNLYGYYGLVYGKRAVYRMPDGSFVGFGAPLGSTLDNRAVSQASVGFRHTFWRGEGLSNLSYSLDYAYVIRKLWETSTTGSFGRTHMIYTSFRYNLP